MFNKYLKSSIVHPKGFEPPSSEPESEILSIELWVQFYCPLLRRAKIAQFWHSEKSTE